MARFYYEDSEQPWRPDSILRRFVSKTISPQRRREGKATGDWRLATGERKNPRALDLGMGYGRNALWLAERGYEVEGWEQDGRYVAEAVREAERRDVAASIAHRDSKFEIRNSKLGTRGELVVRGGDFTRGGWRGPYDIIVISQALHQVKRSAAIKVLARAKKALARGGRLFLLIKLLRDRHIQRVRNDAAWKPVRGERNTWRRPVGRKRGSYHRGRPHTRQMLLSALEPGEIRRALKGLRVRHWRTVVLRSDWEDDWRVTHTVAEIVAERT